MSRKSRLALLVALSCALVVGGVALAQSGNGYDLSWNTINGGGHTFSEGGGYTLGGTIGQPDAGTMSGGDYTLGGGFWGSVVEYLQRVFLPLILKNYGP